MAAELKWRGNEFKQRLRNATSAGLQRATVFFHQQAQMAVNVANPGERVKRGSKKELVSVKSKLKEIETKRSYFDEQSATIKQRTQLRIINEKKFKTVSQGSYTIYPHPSRPGEPPRVRTGFGRKGVVWEYDAAKMAGRVGVTRNALYMFYLEVGTRRIRRRPWLMATLIKHMETIGKLAATGGK